MLRYFYLLNLLMYVNFSFCYEYLLDNDLSRRSIVKRLKTDHRYQRENLQRRKHRKRHDEYDQDPVAEIDVASFIKSAEDEPISDNDPYNLERYGKRYNNYGSLSNKKSNINDDYSDTGAESLQENSRYVDINAPSEDIITNNKIRHGFDNSIQRSLDSLQNRHHKEKKCVLKNIKLPFFSHNKSVITKGKNDKKRKITGFHNIKQGNILFKGSKEMLSKEDHRDYPILHKHYKITKRSFLERLCPVCKRKFIISNTLKSQTRRNDNLKNTYDIRNKNAESHLENNYISNKYYSGSDIPKSNDEDIYKNLWSDTRRKREDDDRNIERQKELEYLEKRVESVTVDNPSINKSKL